MRGAIPVLTRAIRVEDAHPSVGLLLQEPGGRGRGCRIGNELANSDGEGLRLKRLHGSNLLIWREDSNRFGRDLDNQIRACLLLYGCDGSPI